jgi:hypothetical protein
MSIPYSDPSLPQLTQASFDPFQDPPVFAVDYSNSNIPLNSFQVPYYGYLQPAEYAIATITGSGMSLKVGSAVRVTTAAERSANANSYTLAIASDNILGDGTGTLNSQAVGIVTAIGSGDDAGSYLIQFGGIANIGGVAGGQYASNFSPGELYYLSTSSAGAGTTTAPTAGSTGLYSKPLFITLNSTQAILTNDRPKSVTSNTPQIHQFTSSTVFSIGAAVYYNGSTWALATSNSFVLAQSVGIVTSVSGPVSGIYTYQLTFFGIATIGNIGGGVYTGTFTPNQLYYLSAVIPGLGVTSENLLVFKKPLFLTLTSTQVLVFSSPPRREYLSVFGSGPTGISIGTPVTPLSGGSGFNFAVSTISSLASANSCGIVVNSLGGGTYEVATTGVINALSGLVPGSTYYLTGSGQSTIIQPSPIVKPLYTAITTTAALLTTQPAYYSIDSQIRAGVVLTPSMYTPINVTFSSAVASTNYAVTTNFVSTNGSVPYQTGFNTIVTNQTVSGFTFEITGAFGNQYSPSTTNVVWTAIPYA